MPRAKGGGRSERAWRGVGISAESNPSPRSDVPPAKERGIEDLRQLVEFLEPHKFIGGVPRQAVVDLLAERDALREELAATKKYAAEGWAWLVDALNALGAKTVFDIPKAERPE